MFGDQGSSVLQPLHLWEIIQLDFSVKDETKNLKSFSLCAQRDNLAFFADFFATVSFSAQHGNFQRLFLDLTRLNACINFPSGSNFVAGAVRLAENFYNSEPPYSEAINAVFPDLTVSLQQEVGLAVGVVILCIGAGTLALYYIEHLDWMDSFYLSVMSVTTVGYGDRAFKTLEGRIFASFWLLVSTLAVARAFLYLAEARIDKRHRRIAKWVLQRDLTVEDLFAADINHCGFISKSEFVIYKLKEMGKIGEKDILQICNQFNKLDPNDTGKITLPDLLHCSSG